MKKEVQTMAANEREKEGGKVKSSQGNCCLFVFSFFLFSFSFFFYIFFRKSEASVF